MYRHSHINNCEVNFLKNLLCTTDGTAHHDMLIIVTVFVFEMTLSLGFNCSIEKIKEQMRHHTHVHTYMCTYMYVCTYMCARMYVVEKRKEHIFIHICVHIYVYVCMMSHLIFYIHTYVIYRDIP